MKALLLQEKLPYRRLLWICRYLSWDWTFFPVKWDFTGVCCGSDPWIEGFDRRQNLQKYFQPVGLLQVGSYKAFAISQASGDWTCEFVVIDRSFEVIEFGKCFWQKPKRTTFLRYAFSSEIEPESRLLRRIHFQVGQITNWSRNWAARLIVAQL